MKKYVHPVPTGLQADFKQEVILDYLRMCQTGDVQATTHTLLQFLMDQNLLSNYEVIKYIVVRKYPHYLADARNKTEAVEKLAEDCEISEATCRCIVNNFKTPGMIKAEKIRANN
jgi:hypothetical protein